MVVAKASAGETVPEPEVAQLQGRAPAQVAGGEPHEGVGRREGVEQRLDPRQHFAALLGQRAGQELQVGLDEPLQVRYESVAAEAVPFEHLGEDAAVRAAVEVDALGRLFDPEFAGEAGIHGGAPGALGFHHRQVDIEQEDTGHRPSVAAALPLRHRPGKDWPVSIELQAPGARAMIEPAAGGRLHQLFVTIDGTETPLLWSPDDLSAYADADAPLYGGSYPMAPWPNRLAGGRFSWNGHDYQMDNGRDLAIHGLVCDRPWEVVARAGRVVELACAFGDGWPWEGRAWQRFELGPGFLSLRLDVRSAREPFPAGSGWHPWFRRSLTGEDPEAVRLTVPAERQYRLTDQLASGETMPPAGDALLDGSPLGGRRLDECYTALREPRAVIEWPGLRLEMTVECPFPHVQVYTPPDAFCVEPQTCAPNAFNIADPVAGAGVAAAGRALSLASRWTWAVTA